MLIGDMKNNLISKHGTIDIYYSKSSVKERNHCVITLFGNNTLSDIYNYSQSIANCVHQCVPLC